MENRSMREKRQHVRIALRLRYRLSVDTATYTGLTGNISLGGVYLESIDTPLPAEALGQTARIDLFNNDVELISTDCRVVFIGREDFPTARGVGIAFEGADGMALERLQSFLVKCISI